MNYDELNKILYAVPERVDYTDLPEELDLSDVPQDSIDKLKIILNEIGYDKKFKYRAAILLCSWGDSLGLEYLKFLVFPNELGYIFNRISGVDDTGKDILNAIISYRARLLDLGMKSNGEIKNEILPLISRLIELASLYGFGLGYFFDCVGDEFDECLPLIKGYLSEILLDENQYWNIYDTITFLLKKDPVFVENILKENGREIEDFGIKF